MALQCGTTSDGCQGKAGKYRIEYTIPDPSYVRYRYAGEAWREVKDATQNLRHEFVRESTPAQPGQDSVFYRVRVWALAPNMWTAQSGTDQSFGALYLGTQSPNNVIRGPITKLEFFLSGGPPNNSDRPLGHRTATLRVTHALGVYQTTSFWYRQPNLQQSVGNSGLYALELQPPTYVITRSDGRPETTPGIETCTFRVLGANNAVIYSEKRTDCPEAVTVPEQYGLNTGNFVISNSRPSVQLKIVNSEANNRKSTSVLLGNTTIKKLDSPLGTSLFPRVCWDCEEDKKCPEGTCTVECGDKICCYNSLGVSVKEIRK